jgi:serine/threonine protein kinase
MRERSIFDLDPDQLDRLLSIGQDAGKEQGAEGQEAQVDQTRAKPARELEPASPQQSSNPTASLASVVEHPGGWIGQYKLLNILGEGGMGIVFLAEQERPIKRRVALKVIKPGMDSRRVIARFEAERQALALLDHPNIAHVHEAGTTDSGRPYFAMEYVEGLPITEHCDRHRLTIEERLLSPSLPCHPSCSSERYHSPRY